MLKSIHVSQLPCVEHPSPPFIHLVTRKHKEANVIGLVAACVL